MSIEWWTRNLSNIAIWSKALNKRNIRGDHCCLFMAVAIRDWLPMYLDPDPLDGGKYLLPALIY
jgi:hypothetical protein